MTDPAGHFHVSVFHGPKEQFSSGLVVHPTAAGWEVLDEAGELGARGAVHGTFSTERDACREALRLLRDRFGDPTVPCWGTAPNRVLVELGYDRGRLTWRWWPPGWVRVGESVVGPDGDARQRDETPRGDGAPPRRPDPDDATSATAELRRTILTREFLKVVPPGDGSSARCVLMDWNVGGGRVVTLVAFDDGTTSLYLSSGGGVIGAGAHEPVRRAAAAFRAEAEASRGEFREAGGDFPPPPDGASTFYIVTDSATLASGPVPDARLRANDHALAALARAAQETITRIRKARSAHDAG